MHSFAKIAQNEFDPLKNLAAIDPNSLGLNDNFIEGLQPFNCLNINYLNFTMWSHIETADPSS